MSRMLTKLAKEVCSFFFVDCSIDGFGLFSSSGDVVFVCGCFRKYRVCLLWDIEAIFSFGQL